MKRRNIIALSGIAAIGAPLRVPAQQIDKMPAVGVLQLAPLEQYNWLVEGLREGLRQHGLVDGNNMRLLIRHADGKPERLRGLAAMQQFVQQREGKACHRDAQRCRIAPGVCQQCAAPKTSVSPTVASCVARSVRKREQQGKRLV